MAEKRLVQSKSGHIMARWGGGKGHKILVTWSIHVCCKLTVIGYENKWANNEIQCFDVVGWAAGRASGL